MTSRVSKNVLVNFLGRGWGAFLSIAFTPLYIKFLGMEAYGLIGVFITLQALLGILDMGLGTAANREMAVLSASKGNLPQIRNFVRTLEWIYWAMAICIAIAVGMMAYPIAHIWIRPQTLQPQEITAAIVLMGVVLAVQWPTGLYGGALMGLQQQTSLNVLTALFSTIRSVGAVLILWKISPSVISFFLWNAIVIVTQTLAIAGYLWKQIQHADHRPKFEKKLLYETRKFAVEMSGITLMAVAFTQLDKVVLSRVLTLQSFGYYYAASVAAGGLYIFISPIFSAIFPKFSQLVSRHEQEKIRLLYDQASQLMAVAILPIMMILIFFSYDLLFIWTHNKLTAESGATILVLLAIGNTLNGLMNVPYALQLATGDAKPVLKINGCLIAISTPAIIFLANKWGGVGAACAWVGYTLAFWIINTYIVNKQFPDLDIRSLIWNGFLKPVTIAFAIVAIGCMVQWWINRPDQWVNFIIITLTTIAALCATALSSPAIIGYIKDRKQMVRHK